MIHIQTDQGGQDWLKLKLGVISASNISKVLAKKGTDTRNGYLAELVGQVCTGQFDEINGKALEFGKNNESTALAAFSFETGHETERCGFIYKDETRRVGCSPDFKVAGKNIGGELKVPFTSRVFVEFATMGKIKNDYFLQCQLCLYVTGWDSWFFANYNPRMKKNMLHYQVIEKDAETFARFDECIPSFISDMDEILGKLDTPWGSQWS